MEKKPIVLIGALNSEIKYLVEMLESCKIETRGNYKFYKGYIKDYPVIIAKSEVGLINAASCLTLAIEYYNPICIVNEGTAGGIIENRHKKDIIIADECINIISAKTPYKELGEGSNSCDWELMTFTDSGIDEKRVYKLDEKLTHKVNKTQNHLHINYPFSKNFNFTEEQLNGLASNKLSIVGLNDSFLEKILVITFTKKAAIEMKERFKSLASSFKTPGLTSIPAFFKTSEKLYNKKEDFIPEEVNAMKCELNGKVYHYTILIHQI